MPVFKNGHAFQSTKACFRVFFMDLLKNVDLSFPKFKKGSCLRKLFSAEFFNTVVRALSDGTCVSTPVHCPEFQEKTVRCAKNLKICRLGFHPGRNVKLGMLRAYSLLLAGRALRVQAKPLVSAETLTNVGWGFYPNFS